MDGGGTGPVKVLTFSVVGLAGFSEGGAAGTGSAFKSHCEASVVGPTVMSRFSGSKQSIWTSIVHAPSARSGNEYDP